MDGHVEPRSIYREAWDTYRKYPASLLVPGFVLFAVFGLPAALLHETKATGIADVLLLLGIQLLGFTSSMLYYGYCEKVAAQARGGEGVSIRKALSDTSRVLLQLTAAALTAEVLVALGLLLLIVPGVYLAARYAVVAPASAFEHGWPRRSLARSRDLIRSHYKLAFLTVVAMFVFVGCAPKATFDLAITNQTNRAVTVGLVKDGPPPEAEWRPVLRSVSRWARRAPGGDPRGAACRRGRVPPDAGHAGAQPGCR